MIICKKDDECATSGHSIGLWVDTLMVRTHPHLYHLCTSIRIDEERALSTLVGLSQKCVEIVSVFFREEEVWDGFLGPTFANQLHALRTMVVTD